jgi:surface antigen
MRIQLRFVAARVVAVVAAIVCLPALADPPEHAKAHGWRKKHDPAYVGYTGKQWERDYGIIEGRCNRDDIGTVIGAVVGGAIGSKVAEGSENRGVAIVVGSVLGAIVGREIGRDLDDRDRACVGHSLELVKLGQKVRWVNEQTRVSYVLTPLAAVKGDPSDCRRYTLQAALDGRTRASEGRACRAGNGTWAIK